MIEFEWPWIIYCLPLPLLAYWLLPKSKRTDTALHVPFFNSASHFDNIHQPATSRNLLRRICLTLTWFALILAGSNPRWIGEPIELPTSGRDLMLAVDISGSMGTEDMKLGNRTTDRLTVVKLSLIHI